MGIYFIPAGSSSKNREKTLDKSHTVEEICQFLLPGDRDYLRRFFPGGGGIYIWGAGEKSRSDLSQLKAGEYVIDVKNKIVMHIFKYCFFVQLNDTRLPEFLGWDKEKPKAKRRPYYYVYFLKSPLPTTKKDKNYFQNAFNLNSNPQWLIGQRYFNDSELHAALKRTESSSVEDFLGIIPITIQDSPESVRTAIFNPDVIAEPAVTVTIPTFNPPDWLKDLIAKVIALKNDSGHLERDHEDLVASLFEHLGYQRIHDIKFRRGNIDIRIEITNVPWITVEVKADWGLSPDSHGALSQAYNYAFETGSPFVIITNGDRYCIYDRRRGMSYSENLIANLTITGIDQDGVSKLNSLRKENIK
jgi:hypothetical protein